MTEHHARLPERSAAAGIRGRDRSRQAVAVAGAALIAVAGLLHLILVPEYLAEAPVIGLLFLLSGPVTLGVAWRLWRHENLWAWAAGVAAAGGIILGFVLSRTVGLFGYQSDNWAEGAPSLVAEAAFLVLAAVAIPRLPTPRDRRR